MIAINRKFKELEKIKVENPKIQIINPNMIVTYRLIISDNFPIGIWIKACAT